MRESLASPFASVLSSRRACALIVAIGIGLVVAQANGKSICIDLARAGICETNEIQTDPVPYVIGAFGGEQFPAPDGALWEKWRTVEAEIKTDEALIVQCRGRVDCPWPAVALFASIVDGAAKRQGFQRVDFVNRAVNLAIAFVEDFAASGIPDRWQAPVASIQTGRGDCEDYSIAKYVALRMAGMPIDDRQLVIVRDIAKRRDHMVVGVRHEGRWFILDNNTLRIREDSELPNYVPQFAIDDRGLRQYGRPSPPGGFRMLDLVSTCSDPVA